MPIIVAQERAKYLHFAHGWTIGGCRDCSGAVAALILRTYARDQLEELLECAECGSRNIAWLTPGRVAPEQWSPGNGVFALAQACGFTFAEVGRPSMDAQSPRALFASLDARATAPRELEGSAPPTLLGVASALAGALVVGGLARLLTPLATPIAVMLGLVLGVPASVLVRARLADRRERRAGLEHMVRAALRNGVDRGQLGERALLARPLVRSAVSAAVASESPAASPSPYR